MGNYENIVKVEEMRKCIEDGDCEKAQKILDTMDTAKIKIPTDLGVIAEVYTQNGRYDEAKQILLKIYSKTKTRKVLYQLVWISIKSENIEEAEKYLKEFVKLAPQDFGKFIFRYKIDKMKNESIEVLIQSLESLKKTEYIEQWAYELAKLYYKVGNEEKCIRECSDIILWFGEGVYVEKAKLLKSYYSGEKNKTVLIEELKRRAQEEKTRRDEGLKDNKSMDVTQNDKDESNIVIDQMQKDLIDNSEIIDKKTKDTEDVSDNSDRTQNIEVENAGINIVDDEIDKVCNTLESSSDNVYNMNEIQEMSKEIGVDLELVFGDFLYTESLRKQIIKSIEIILQDNTKCVRMVITGHGKSGKTTMAKYLTVFIHMIGKMKSSRIARISSERLNSMDLLAKKESLRNCCLIVENARELKSATIESIMELINDLKGEITVILEDDSKHMNKLFDEYPELMDIFKNRLNLPQYTKEDYYEYAFTYIKSKGYRLNPNAQAVLQDFIDQLVKREEDSNQLVAIKKVMQSAINAAEIRNKKNVYIHKTKETYKEGECLYIQPEDFLQKD